MFFDDSILAEALADPSLACFEQGRPPDSLANCAAYVLAVALGRCRLFGVQLTGDMNGVLPLAIAFAAAQEMNLSVCCELRDASAALPDMLNLAIEIEAEDACADLLGASLNAWAAQIAICEAYRAEPCETADAKKLAVVIEYLAGELALVDDALRAVALELTLAASGYLLENLRNMLTPEYLEIAPWWLSGRLEKLVAALAKRESKPWLSDSVWQAARTAIKAAT